MAYKNKEDQKEHIKQWRKNNPEKIREYRKQYYKDNAEEEKERSKQWCKDNPEKVKERSKQYRKNNLDKEKERSKQWHKDNPEYKREWNKNNLEKIKDYRKKNCEYQREWYKNNLEKIREKQKNYCKNNLEKIRKNKNKYHSNRCKTDERFRFNKIIRSAINQSLKGNKNGRHWEILVGYALKDLLKHLKKTVPVGYTWQDFMEGRLHIDHIIPIDAFNFTRPEHTDFKRCWALSNLRLLPAKENRIKYNKLDRPFQPALRI